MAGLTTVFNQGAGAAPVEGIEWFYQWYVDDEHEQDDEIKIYLIETDSGIEWQCFWFEDDDPEHDIDTLFLYSGIPGVSAGPPNNRGFLRNVGRLLNA
jgi:hypothetical protein